MILASEHEAEHKSDLVSDLPRLVVSSEHWAPCPPPLETGARRSSHMSDHTWGTGLTRTLTPLSLD